MRIWFVGTGKFAALCLKNLVKNIQPFDHSVLQSLQGRQDLVAPVKGDVNEVDRGVRNIELEKIITGLPTRSGRGGKEQASQVELEAVKLNLNNIVTRTGLLSKNEDLINEVETNAPDLIFVIDFGQIIREPFLNSAKYGCLNIHPSLLPKWRGAAPVQRALMNGDDKVGVTVFRL
ncbi:MAG: hypothetical protein IJQ63_02835, partial [Synergistaceae bacterium]|nr:hypothetical protein [Synergistaceae bacterium]